MRKKEIKITSVEGKVKGSEEIEEKAQGDLSRSTPTTKEDLQKILQENEITEHRIESFLS